MSDIRGLAGVEVIPLTVHRDQRGWLAEVLRPEQVQDAGRFGQIHVTTAHPGFVKGNHYHLRKFEWFCVVSGRGMLVLEDVTTGERREVGMGEDDMVTVRIPPSVAHGIKNTGKDLMFLLVYNQEAFDPLDPDTFSRVVIG